MEGKQRATVLVVDDEPGLCELLTIMLSEQGFQVYSTTNGVEALDMLSRGAMDVVISDLKMPRLNGFELLRQVNKGFPNVAFIMMTGTDDLSSGIEAMRENAADYLLKPLCSEIVVASVYRAIEKKRLDLELDRYRHELEEMVVQRTKELEIALKSVERTYDETVEALGPSIGSAGQRDCRSHQARDMVRHGNRQSHELFKAATERVGPGSVPS
jgi:DNA-binding NtrC family response regulator